MFLWAPIPERFRAAGSLEVAKQLLQESLVAVSPGWKRAAPVPLPRTEVAAARLGGGESAVVGGFVRSGENVYFPDESHLNETGHAVVADALAAFLGKVEGRP
jgi:hypothetical protein